MGVSLNKVDASFISAHRDPVEEFTLEGDLKLSAVVEGSAAVREISVDSLTTGRLRRAGPASVKSLLFVFESHLFQQQISYEPSEARVLKLELCNSSRAI